MPRRLGRDALLVNVALALLVVAVWSLTHVYEGISLDGQLYAVQALAHLHPGLTRDIYLQNTSQDQFTVFSPLYAAAIGRLGLERAALLLHALSTAWLLMASWAAARRLFGAGIAWLAVVMIVLADSSYGAYGVFRYAEPFLTARSLAEPMVITGLACEFAGRRRTALAIMLAALLIHPLMALPGLLVLGFLRTSAPFAAAGAGALVSIALIVAATATLVPSEWRPLAVMDPVWSGIAHERSKFLFLQFWSLQDLDTNARPFLSLAASSLVLGSTAIRRLCLAAILVGASGLLVALIASVVGPVALLVQGQAWRWEWITAFVAVLVLVPTIFEAARDEKCGPICALLLALAWTFRDVDGTACAAVATALLLSRRHLSLKASAYLRWASIGIGLVVIVWAMASSWTYLSPSFDLRSEPMVLQRLRNIFGLRIPVLLLVCGLWHLLRNAGSPRIPAAVGMLLLLASPILVHAAYSQFRPVDSLAQQRDFANWRNAIPPAGSVYVDDGKDSPIFTWFTLERPSYLSLDQSAGVIFSRATALEIKRRSDNLVPIGDPDWRLISRSRPPARDDESFTGHRKLTAPGLVQMCRDPALGFLIAREAVGFEPIPHLQPGPWQDWNLYSCERVRQGAGTP